MFCFNGSSLVILNRNKETIEDCFIKLYVLSPVYLIFILINTYLLANLNDLPRLNCTNKKIVLKLIRCVSILLLFLALIDLFSKYFLKLNVNNDLVSDQENLAWNIITDFYKLIGFSFHCLLAFNKNLFNLNFPIKLLISIFCLVISNLINLINYIHILKPISFSNLSQFDKYNFVYLIILNVLLFLYFLIIITSYLKTQNSVGIEIEDSEEDLANYYSYLTFKWLKPCMKKGFRREIKTVLNLPKLPSDLNIKLVYSKFMSKYLLNNQNDFLNNPIFEPNLLNVNSYLNSNIKYEDVDIKTDLSKKNSLIISLLKSFGGNFMFLGLLRFLNDCLNFSGPILLNQLVQFVELKNSDLKTGIFYAICLFITSLLGSLLNIHFSNLLNKFCLRIKISLINLIYQKTLIIKYNELNKFSIGQIVNYMSIDNDSIVNAFPSFHSFWSLPFQLLITLYLLYNQIGISFLVGVCFVIILIPINKFLSDYIGKVQTRLMQFKDQRVKIITEFLDGIRVIKFCAWEKYFINRINSVREKELNELKSKKYLDAGCVYFWASTPILMSVLTFITYVLLGNKLTPSKVFTSLALFNMLIMPLNSFPWVVNGLVQAWVSIKRLEKFLNLNNLNWLNYYTLNEIESDQILIDFRSANFRWDDSKKSGNENCLKDISAQIRKGDLIGIIGKVGSGKTTLLHAIMGELEKEDGKIRIRPDLCSNGFAYVGQEVWIQQGTIQENILFGSEMRLDFYNKVIDACSLRPDLESFPKGDQTPVGENGICLSGGQKARLTLARACYDDAKDVYLLDDPISAVDAHVAKHIFSKCINELLQDKTRIITTHHYEYLENADLVLVVENGKIVKYGKGSEIIPGFKRADKGDRTYSIGSYMSLEMNNEEINKKLDQEEINRIDEEEKENGVISYIVYKYYCLSVGLLLCFLTILFLFLMQASKNLTDFWLSYWTQHHHLNLFSYVKNKTYVLNPHLVHFYTPKGFFHELNELQSDDSTKEFFFVYGILCFSNTFFTLIRAFLFAYSGITAGKYIHEVLIENLIKASLRFFDLTPKGRILNRLSSDMYAIDDSLPFILNIFLACLFGLAGILVVTCYSLPWFSLSLIPISIIYYSIQNYYRWTSRELKRLSSVSLSPLYTHFHETIRGLVTIRSFRHVKKFLDQNEFYLNNYIRASYSSMSASLWLSFRLQMLSVLMITIVGITAVIQHMYGTANASLIGLALSYILSVTGLLNGLITSFTETEKEMVSVERAHQFKNLEQENWLGFEQITDLWPLNPKLEFKNVCLRYKEDSMLALNNVTFEINPGEKIGICGRTGSGKSSLLTALFRGAELESGDIRIDDVNVRSLNLHDLRDKLSIIPQDPFLFESSLKENLDPTCLKTDDELWSALKDVNLDTKFRTLENELNFQIEERGKNLSCGEKQLICLARAILSNRKILCIDEATAQVDFETDNFIQETIRTKFRGVTVLTIAHRINTIFDYDKILVMDAGKVAEFDTTKNLLENKNSLFYSLVNETKSLKKKNSF
nr:ATP-binding cassette transporter Abcc10 [Brachionus angularis]